MGQQLVVATTSAAGDVVSFEPDTKTRYEGRKARADALAAIAAGDYGEGDHYIIEVVQGPVQVRTGGFQVVDQGDVLRKRAPRRGGKNKDDAAK